MVTPRKKVVKKQVQQVKNKGGRPRAVIDWDKLEKLVHIQCTGEECAAILDVDYDTLDANIKRKYGFGFSEYFKKKGAGGKASLRRRQFAMSENNVTMAIWLGKQYLGQTDRNEEVRHVFTEEIQMDSDKDKLDKFKA
jgi:hypothetical protein